MNDWIVILEFSSGDMGGRIDVAVVEYFVARLAVWRPVGLYHPDRYALQLHVPARTADEALHEAVCQHRKAAASVGSSATFSRAEVVSLAEFERTWDSSCSSPALSGPASLPRSDDTLVCAEVYAATRALVSATTVEEVTTILTDCVVAVGGTVQLGSAPAPPGTTAIDFTVVPEWPLFATADSISVPAMILERWLPPLVDDARHKLALLLGTR
ncbi:MAG TPA: hypothetical protein VHT75_09460 [Acidimicrobiales bacterium]|jgi:hypothetical protein|nr:hypothetical protein [Acidimicrobiales bacterium]